MNKNKKSYVIYDRDDLPICVGNSNECAKFLNTTLNNFYSILSKQKNGKIKSSKYRIFELDNSEE